MGMRFAPTWLRQVSPLLHKTTLTTEYDAYSHITAVLINVPYFRVSTKRVLIIKLYFVKDNALYSSSCLKNFASESWNEQSLQMQLKY